MNNQYSNTSCHISRAGVVHALIYAISASTLFAVSRPAFSEVSETLNYADYSVEASSVGSLAKALNHTSPIQHDGRVFHAFTTWRVSWHYHWTEDSNGDCRITQVSTGLDTNITLPKLIGGSDSLRERFGRYLAALNEHELGHYQIGHKAALEVDRQLQAMPAMPDCQRLSSAAKNLAYRIVNRFKDEEHTYDLITVHGRLQGARLDY